MFNLENSISPLVSVVIPTYNAEKFIERTVSSVRKQTYSNWELIIVDDASNDRTVQIVEDFQKIDPRISITRLLKNSGSPAHPKNIGIEKSRGELIAFLDHDDEWIPEKIEKQVSLLVGRGLDFVACDSLVISGGSFIGFYKVPKIPKEFLKEEILKGNFIHSCSSVIIRKSVFDKIGGFDERLDWSDDRDLYLRMLFNDFLFDSLSEALFFWHSQSNSVGKSLPSIKKAKELEYFVRKHWDKFLEFNQTVYLLNKRIIANHYCLAGEIRKGRSLFIKILKKRFDFYTLFLFLLSFLGTHTYRLISRIKRKIISGNVLEKA